MATSHFWHTLPRPIVGLAPMNGITDHPFRYIQKKYGNPTLLYTEFTSVRRLEIGDRDIARDFLFDESQRPIVAQIFGHNPDLFRRMAILLCQLGFDGIDINMGCPSPSVVDHGAGAGLIRTPDLAQAIIKATQQGVVAWQNGATAHDDPGIPADLLHQVEARHAELPPAYRQPRAIPVSVKTRIGYDSPCVDGWIPKLLEQNPAAIAIHGRTLDQGSTGRADWDEIGCAAELARGSGVVMLGNGDVTSLDDAHRKAATYGLDGVLIGRASYGNPFVFRPGDRAAALAQNPYCLLQIALEHARLFDATISQGNQQRFLRMRKHLSWYARSLPGITALRRRLIVTNSAIEAEAALAEYFAYRNRWAQQLNSAGP
ncbi:MAG: tRNA-dihydrouridine synthase [Anaerolineales bacterium]|nr:tRNA-dihydrouridine synthase [Anaerolineales bacterium]